jgi:hypothetical protein
VSITVPPTGPAGAVVTYALPTATDATSGVSATGVSPAPTSGSTIPVGTTTVTCKVANDVASSGESGRCLWQGFERLCAYLFAATNCDSKDVFNLLAPSAFSESPIHNFGELGIEIGNEDDLSFSPPRSDRREALLCPGNESWVGRRIWNRHKPVGLF